MCFFGADIVLISTASFIFRFTGFIHIKIPALDTALLATPHGRLHSILQTLKMIYIVSLRYPLVFVEPCAYEVRIIIQRHAIVLGVKCYDLNDELFGRSINRFDVFLGFSKL